jgi:hypothetical protein
MQVLHISTCPICGAMDSLALQVVDQTEEAQSAYVCWECGSVLVWLGDDLWLRSDRWAYQHVGREDKRHLLYQPLTTDELQQLADSAPKEDPTPRSVGTRPDIIEMDATPPRGISQDPDIVLETPSPPPPPRPEDVHRPPARAPQPQGPTGDMIVSETGETSALVPMASVLPEGMTLALVQYRGSKVVPVAIFEEGQLRAVTAAQRRGRGSPLLAISVGLTIMCLICSAATLVLSSLWEEGIIPMAMPAPLLSPMSGDTPMPTASPVPSDTPAPTDTPVPTATPLPTESPTPAPTTVPPVLAQGVTDYALDTGSHLIIGEVLNTSASHLHFVEVIASLYDSDAQLVATGSTFVELRTVEAGGRAPFKLIIQDLPRPFDTYELDVDYITTEQDPVRLEILNHGALTDETGAYRISGEARNPYDFAVKFAEVVATYYNSGNQVIRVEMLLNEADILQPGQTYAFELVLGDPPPDLSHYKLQTEGVRQ